MNDRGDYVPDTDGFDGTLTGGPGNSFNRSDASGARNGRGLAPAEPPGSGSKEVPDMKKIKTGSTAKGDLNAYHRTIIPRENNPLDMLRRSVPTETGTRGVFGRANMGKVVDWAEETDLIVDRVSKIALTDVPAWREVDDPADPSRIFDVSLNKPTFLPDEDGRFRGQALVTLHRDSELSKGHRVVVAKTVFATIEGHKSGDEIAIDKVSFRTR